MEDDAVELDLQRCTGTDLQQEFLGERRVRLGTDALGDVFDELVALGRVNADEHHGAKVEEDDDAQPRSLRRDRGTTARQSFSSRVSPAPASGLKMLAWLAQTERRREA